MLTWTNSTQIRIEHTDHIEVQMLMSWWTIGDKTCEPAHSELVPILKQTNYRTENALIHIGFCQD